MRAEIIAIGDELTTGQRLDTNSQWLAERLLEIGVPVAFHTTVGDVLADNLLVFRQATERADIVVATGGLGPTADDLTRQALATVAGVPLVQDDASLAHIKALFARRQREMPATNLVQAMFPQGSRPIPNPHGTAPGIDIEIRRRGHLAPRDAVECGHLAPRDDMSARGASGPQRSARIFALPGVPAEMKEMWQMAVAPAISELLGIKRVIAHYRIKCFGVGESDLEAMLPDLIARQRYPLVGITVHEATITLRITAEGETAAAARAAMQPTIDTIHECLGDLIFGEEDDELERVIVRLLRERKQTLGVTEWGTCGLISHWLARLEAGDVFRTAAVMSGTRYWSEPGTRLIPDCDFELQVGPRPAADSPTTTPGNLAIRLFGPGDHVLRKDYPYAGHPDILRPRAAKQAINLLRLHLLGKA